MARDVFQLVITGKCATQMVQNVLCFRSAVDNAPNPGQTARHAVLAWDDTMQENYLDMLPTNYWQSSIRARRINNGGGNSATFIAALVQGDYGAITDDALTGAQAHFPFTDEAGYYGTGKMFVPGAPQGGIVDGLLDPAYSTAVNTFITTLYAGMSNGGDVFDFVIWSPKLSAGFPPLGGGVSIKPGYIGRRLKPTA